jgi:hypothetical protein
MKVQVHKYGPSFVDVIPDYQATLYGFATDSEIDGDHVLQFPVAIVIEEGGFLKSVPVNLVKVCQTETENRQPIGQEATGFSENGCQKQESVGKNFSRNLFLTEEEIIQRFAKASRLQLSPNASVPLIVLGNIFFAANEREQRIALQSFLINHYSRLVDYVRSQGTDDED